MTLLNKKQPNPSTNTQNNAESVYRQILELASSTDPHVENSLPQNTISA